MHIVFAASECVPFVKTGGVAEVVGALPKELARQGHQVTVYLPLYRQVQKHLKDRRIAIPSLAGRAASRSNGFYIADRAKLPSIRNHPRWCTESP